MEKILATATKKLQFGSVLIEYTQIDGQFWLNATSLLKQILKNSIVTIQKLKEGDWTEMDGTRAEQVFVPLPTIEKLFRTRIADSKAEKTELFGTFQENGGIEKLTETLHVTNGLVYHTISSLLATLDEKNTAIESLKKALNGANESCEQLGKQNSELATNLSTIEIILDNKTNSLSEYVEKLDAAEAVIQQKEYDIQKYCAEIDDKNTEIETLTKEQSEKIVLLALEHENTITQITAEHNDIIVGKNTEIEQILTNNEKNKIVTAENHTKTIETLTADYEAKLQPLKERSNLRKFWLGRDASLYSQIALQLVCMAFMFPLINKHYPFESLPNWIGVIFQVMLTTMLPIASILFALRKKRYWLWGIVLFEVLFSNSQTKLFNPLLGDNIHLIENTAVTFFLPLLLVAFGTLTSERETNKALLEIPKE